MAAPLLHNSNKIAKDAKKDFYITYQWDDSKPQQTGNRITIYNNQTNQVVYTNTEDDSYRLNCLVPANTLKNGTLYKVTVSVLYNNTITNPSEPILFYCYTTPTFGFENLTANQLIKSSNFKIKLFYSQPEGEELQSYQIYLYGTNKNLIYETGTLYDCDSLQAPISGLSNNTPYYLKAKGITISEMELETDYLPVTVTYLQPNMYALIQLDNLYEEGYINLTSNIVAIGGIYYPEQNSPSYIKGTYIDLRTPGSKVVFHKGFWMDRDFTLLCYGYGFTEGSLILSLSNGQDQIDVYCRRGEFLSTQMQKRVYFELYSKNQMTYSIYSNYLEIPSDEQIIGFCMTRKHNHYELIGKYKEQEVLMP